MTKLQQAIKAELFAGATAEEIKSVVDQMNDAYCIVTAFKAGTKVCKICNEIHPISEFNKRTQNKDGLNASCKSCLKTWNKEYKANKARAKAQLESFQTA